MQHERQVMFFLQLIEFGITVILLTFIVTQIIVPIILGRALFPLFKKEAKNIDRKVVEVREEIDIVTKEQERVDYLQRLQQEKEVLQAKVDQLESRTKKKKKKEDHAEEE